MEKLKIQTDMSKITKEKVLNYHKEEINRLVKQVRENETSIKVPVSPYDVIISHLGANKVAEISERSYQVLMHSPGVSDMSTTQLQNRKGNDPTVKSDFLQNEYYYIKERGSTWNELYEENQKEWEAFCMGKKTFCFVSSAVAFPFILQSKIEKPVTIVYSHVSEHYNQSISLIQYLSSLFPVNCHILQSDITERIFIDSCMSDCAQRGAVIKHPKEQLHSIYDDIGKESWNVLMHSLLHSHTMDPLRTVVLPSNYSVDVVTDEDREKIENYNTKSNEMKIVCIRDILESHGLTEKTMSLIDVFTHLNDCSTINKEIVVRYFQQIMRSVERDFTRINRITNQIGYFECQETQLQKKDYQIQKQRVTVYEFTTNCSLSYQSLQKLSSKG